jgi:hypothetical protein
MFADLAPQFVNSATAEFPSPAGLYYRKSLCALPISCATLERNPPMLVFNCCLDGALEREMTL